ncbi:ATP-binding protein [Sphingomonas sp. LR60]|uniref:ATP-binding protein n=1 Tax=Sphingomonas sp. LR60 TaxID=3050233 RepID=UPI002FE0269C
MYPEYACREALINAIAHRDYSQEGRGIEIHIFDDRLEVRSPGSLLSTLTIESLNSLTGVHQSRNTFVARALREIGYMREIGEGVRRIYELMKSNELEEPEFYTDLTTFGVRLSNKTLYSQQHLIWLDNFSHLDLTREEKAVVVMGYDGRVLSPNDILNGLGIVDTDDFRKIITNLTDKDVLESTMPKAKATRIAQVKRINIRDVSRFQVKIPDPNRPPKRDGAARGKKAEQETRSVIDMPSMNEGAKLYLGNVPTNLSKAELISTFRKQGYNVDITFPKRRSRARSSCAFLQFETIAEAEYAMNSLNGLSLGDRILVARKANAIASNG